MTGEVESGWARVISWTKKRGDQLCPNADKAHRSLTSTMRCKQWAVIEDLDKSSYHGEAR